MGRMPQGWVWLQPFPSSGKVRAGAASPGQAGAPAGEEQSIGDAGAGLSYLSASLLLWQAGESHGPGLAPIM